MPSRRGLTFLETLFASALLALVAAAVFGALSFVLGRQHHEQRTLAAYELANRIILQYLDDPDQLPDQALPLEYGKDRFRWTLTIAPVTVTAANEAPKDAAETRRSLLDRVTQISVRVWLGEESGGSRDFEPDSPMPRAALSRIMYPMAYRNPDSFDRLINTDAGRRRLFDDMTGGSDRSTPAGARPSSPSQPATPRGATPTSPPKPVGTRPRTRPSGGGT
ncbi:MAG: hypothetical protein IT432_06655 [Phycisphaerales bacterium]|nr:hypothetical protein [Phycisphaerales bacterium]